MATSDMRIKCPKCGQEIVQPTATLNDDSKLTCPSCGQTFDFEKVKGQLQDFLKEHKGFKITAKGTIKF